MSSHIPRLDQENRLKFASADATKNIQSNKPVSTEMARKKFKRVPLSGKDHNQIVPSLSKSQSSLNAFSVGQTKRMALGRPPSLNKSKSSLGFVHKNSQDVQPQQQPMKFPREKTKLVLDKLKSDTLDASKATRKVQLVNKNFVSDDLQKKSSEPLPPVSLKDTVTPYTLHSSQIRQNNINISNVDPVKKQVFNRKNKLPLGIENEPVQTIPDIQPPSPYIPAYLESDVEIPDDIQPSTYHEDLTLGVLNFDSLSEDENSPDLDSSPVGLNQQELQDLLD